MTQLPATKITIQDVIDEHEKKSLELQGKYDTFKRTGSELSTSATVFGNYGGESLNLGDAHMERKLASSLLYSAWSYTYSKLPTHSGGRTVKELCTAKDKERFKRFFANLPPFTKENIRKHFGDYILDPRANTLRGLAEVFCSLDPAYKSHEKVKIGVKGLPKRVIISNVNSKYGYGYERVKDIVTAIALYQNKRIPQHYNPPVKDSDSKLKQQGWFDIEEILEHEDGEIAKYYGVRVKRFNNGNAHMFFAPDTLRDINLALAEYYGDSLPDCAEEKPTKKQESTAVSKDLQYYPTPQKVIAELVNPYHIKGKKVLEPSCGCGRIMDAIVVAGGEVFGVEYDAGRAQQCKDKGHKVLRGNFLDVEPKPEFDHVIMNPPFYGKHYAKHIKHAMKFLKEGGRLVSVLPITARYDHGLLDDIGTRRKWSDLPVGSFSESGTNINTCILTVFK